MGSGKNDFALAPHSTLSQKGKDGFSQEGRGKMA
jgi:hypothetical protein